MLAGMDLGATLHKVALADDASLAGLELLTFPATDPGAARAAVLARRPRRIGLTGGLARATEGRLGPVDAAVVPEFDAWARGAERLAARDETPLDARYLLVSLGTGTSILLVADGQASRAGGTPLGGGTVLGLGSLLLGTERYEDVCALARDGRRQAVDLLVGEVYPDGPSPLAPDLTAAHFGRVRSRRREDLAHAVVGLVAENVALMAGSLALAHAVPCVAFGGSTLAGNPALRAILAEITGFFGCRTVFLRDGSHCGAVGALLAG